MEEIKTAPAANVKAHYSAALIYGGTVYISGQLPIDYEAGKSVPQGDIAAQTRQALKNLDRTLLQSGTTRQQVLKTTVYIADISYWPVVNEVYAEYFGEHKPARTVVPTNTLHFGALIEIEAIAYIK